MALEQYEQLDPIANNMMNIISQPSGGTVISRDRLDLTRIGDPDDRNFMRTVIDTLLNVEPGNTDLLVRMNTDHAIYLVWVQGLRQPVNKGTLDLFYDLRHPVNGFQGVGNVQVYPAKSMQPMKLCVEVNPYGPRRLQQEQRPRLENGQQRYRTLPDDRRRHHKRRVSSSSSSPSPDRRHSRSPIRQSRSSSPEQSVLSRLNPFSGGGSRRSGRRKR